VPDDAAEARRNNETSPIFPVRQLPAAGSVLSVCFFQHIDAPLLVSDIL
jgi:hypothetical protein